ncbi:MAG: hypothetical protein QXW00_02455 [Candidatus Woesearchaeota archaeon]
MKIQNILIVISIVVIAAVLAVLVWKPFREMNQPYTYNGFVFEREGPLWYTQVQVGKYLYRVPFHYLPSELENVSVSGSVDKRFLTGNGVYLVFDPLADKSEMPYIFVTIFDLETNLLTYFGRTPEVACSRQDNAACKNYTVTNCSVDNSSPIIQIESFGNASVFLRGNCVYLRGSGNETIKAAERFTLLYYGIMP